MTNEYQQEEATPVPCDRTEDLYPNLDENLADVVGQYERCEKTETEAAALAPDNHQNMVLVEALAGTEVKAVEKWMEAQSIRPSFVEAKVTDPHRVYAFVRVSLLGALSQRKGISAVNIPEDQGNRDINVKFPAPTNTAVITAMRAKSQKSISPDSEGPELPWWLKGYSHPRIYPKMRGTPRLIASLYENGQWEETKDHANFICLRKPGDDSGDIAVGFNFLDEGNNETVIRNWLQTAGLDMDDPRNLIQEEIPGVTKSTVVYLPIPKMIELSTLPEVHKIEGHGCGYEDTSSFGTPGGTKSKLGPSPQLGDIVTQGRSQHMVDDWQDNNPAYKGQNVKIGIIDSDFNGITDLLSDELPQSTKVHGYCWTFQDHQAPTSDLDRCDYGFSYHGTNLAEIIADMAPEAELYVSNVTFTDRPLIQRQRFRQAVDYMVRNGVSIINHSQNWGFEESLGRGENPGHTLSANKTVEDSATGLRLNNIDYDRVIWAVAAGNDGQRSWYGPFKPVSRTNYYHEWSPDNDRIYLNHSNGGRYNPTNSFDSVEVEARWDDNWFGADCDFQIEAYEERTDGTRRTRLMLENNAQSNGSTDQPFKSDRVLLNRDRHYSFRFGVANCSSQGDEKIES